MITWVISRVSTEHCRSVVQMYHADFKKSLNFVLSFSRSTVRDGRSLHLHESEKQLPHGGPPGGLLRLLLHPGLDQLPHDSDQRLPVPDPQETQMRATEWMQKRQTDDVRHGRTDGIRLSSNQPVFITLSFNHTIDQNTNDLNNWSFNSWKKMWLNVANMLSGSPHIETTASSQTFR